MVIIADDDGVVVFVVVVVHFKFESLLYVAARFRCVRQANAVVPLAIVIVLPAQFDVGSSIGDHVPVIG